MNMPEQTNRIFAIKTTSKQERTVADNIKKVIDNGDSDVKVLAIIVPDELKGYVLVETSEQMNRIEQLVEKVPHARVVLHGETTLAEVAHFLVPKACRKRNIRRDNRRDDSRTVQGRKSCR